MADSDRWQRAWSDASARLTYNARKVGNDKQRRYWDLRSAYYDDMTRGDEPLRDAVVGYMVREKILVPGDSVLEIGCGTGQYTLPMAEVAGRVTGLDISGDMLDRMMREAGKRGLSNVRPVCSKWEDYVGEEKYGLVFSAFCPGVNEPQAFFRMEEFSARACCYVTGGGIGQPAFITELWERLTGEKCTIAREDEFFSFNALYEAGRCPSAKYFSYRAPQKYVDHAVDNAILYFDMVLGPDEERKKMIVDYFNTLPEKDSCEGVDRSLYLVYWEPGAE